MKRFPVALPLLLLAPSALAGAPVAQDTPGEVGPQPFQRCSTPAFDPAHPAM